MHKNRLTPIAEFLELELLRRIKALRTKKGRGRGADKRTYARASQDTNKSWL